MICIGSPAELICGAERRLQAWMAFILVWIISPWPLSRREELVWWVLSVALTQDRKSFDIYIAAKCPETLVDSPYLRCFRNFPTEEQHLHSPQIIPGIFHLFIFSRRPWGWKKINNANANDRNVMRMQMEARCSTESLWCARPEEATSGWFILKIPKSVCDSAGETLSVH